MAMKDWKKEYDEQTLITWVKGKKEIRVEAYWDTQKDTKKSWFVRLPSYVKTKAHTMHLFENQWQYSFSSRVQSIKFAQAYMRKN